MEMTLFNCDWRELSKSDLDTEIRCQKRLRAILRRELNEQKKRSDNMKPSRLREDKIEFFTDYLKILDGDIAEMDERFNSMSDKEFDDVYFRRERGKAKIQQIKDNRHRAKTRPDYDGISISWDREKFMLVARDRGYLTEASVLHAVSKELLLNRERAKLILSTGKFTWGQVMCLGAMLKMTPKEFCDIFLAGYFVDYYGQFVASYDNLDKSVLLKREIIMYSKKELAEIDALAEQLDDLNE